MTALSQLDPKIAGVLILMEGVRQALSQRDAETARQAGRMQRLARRSQALRHRTGHSVWLRLPFLGDVPAKMRQAGMTLSPLRRLMTCLALALPVCAGVGYAFGPLPGLAAACVVGVVGPTVWINHVRAKRLRAFTKQLPMRWI